MARPAEGSDSRGVPVRPARGAEQFHERIAELTRNREMVRALKAINARIHYVRWLDMKRRYTQQDHLRIVKALRARDAAKTAGVARDQSVGSEERVGRGGGIRRTGVGRRRDAAAARGPRAGKPMGCLNISVERRITIRNATA